MTTVRDLCRYLESVAPIELAEDWDNVGLLIGDAEQSVQRAMTCLTLTPDTCLEAIDAGVNLVVTHHPLPFRPLKRITTATTVGSMLWRLAGAGVSVYSPHTAWDSSATGVNQQLAEGLQLDDIRPLQLHDDLIDVGSGRWGNWSTALTLEQVIQRVKQFLSLTHIQCVGNSEHLIDKVAVACGSAGSFLAAACEAGCQMLLTGETNFHTCLEAEALGIALVLPGHYASERFALESLASILQTEFPELQVWASRRESDPLRFV